MRKYFLLAALCAAWLSGACSNTTTIVETVVVRQEIRATPEQVFDYMADPKNAPESASNIEGEGLGRTNDWSFEVAGIRKFWEKELLKVKGALEK